MSVVKKSDFDCDLFGDLVGRLDLELEDVQDDFAFIDELRNAIWCKD